jgi:hypothetical protein
VNDNGESEIIPVVSVPGERGKQGDPGQQGGEGPRGLGGFRGLTGATGSPGPAMSRGQAVAMFGLIVLVGALLTVLLTAQTRELGRQLDLIQANAVALEAQRVERCYAGVEFVERTNAQYDALIGIERILAEDPEVSRAGRKAAADRLKAYQRFKTELPANPCPPR